MNESKDRTILRELARRVAEYAALPIQQERAGLIQALNELRPTRAVVLADPEGGWVELIPYSDLLCQDPLMREWERALRVRIMCHEHIGSDMPITANFNVGPVFKVGSYGFDVQWDRPENRGAAKWDAPIKTYDDFKKLHPREIDLDQVETDRRLALAKDLFGDLLNVRVRGGIYWTQGLTQDLVFLRGLEQIMEDVYDNPQLLHDLMGFLRDTRMKELDLLEERGWLFLNNGPDDYVGSGGYGLTSELPQKDFAGKVRLKDQWTLVESQEFVGIGPDQFNEFALQYHAPIANRFGLVCYGCCEPLHAKIDLVKKAIPRLRRVSVSAWFDVRVAAEKLGNRYIYSWKPNPALICRPTVDWALVESVTRDMFEATRGCCVEMFMKDTHTFHGDKSRVKRWTEMCLAMAREYAGK